MYRSAAPASEAPKKEQIKASGSLPPGAKLMDMPALSPTMSQGNISSWSVKEGDEVTSGELLD